MNLKNLFGVALIVAGAALAVAGFRHPDVTWFAAGCVLCVVGMLRIRRRKRGRRIQGSADGDADDLADLGDLSDWDDGHHSSGGHSGDHLDLPSIDFDN